MSNRLAEETSPYLLQHADNPVDWYPWGEEALNHARAEDKPILLSIGYSACHWCHVMAHECFENDDIAHLMNENFVNIKVDREERPDLDAIYMEAVQAMTGSGGWPLTVFLTPENKPFFGGTYFPPEDRRDMPGFPRVLMAIADAYQNRRSEIETAVQQTLRALTSNTKSSLIKELLVRLMSSQKSTFDSLQKKGWALVDAQQHFLGNLQGKALDSSELVVLLGIKNRFGASYFQVLLRNESGEVSHQPVVAGLHNQGKYPSYNWIEIISLPSRVSFSSGKQVLDIPTSGLAQQLFQYLADLIPPGGHMMVEYDSPEQQNTARSLALGIPPVATPLGYMLVLVVVVLALRTGILPKVEVRDHVSFRAIRH